MIDSISSIFVAVDFPWLYLEAMMLLRQITNERVKKSILYM
jgi:hypothetical protein